MTWAVAAISLPWRFGGLTLGQGSDRCCRCGVVQAGAAVPLLNLVISSSSFYYWLMLINWEEIDGCHIIQGLPYLLAI
jgi:hypothetical protein